MSERTLPIRRGVQRLLTMDPDAVELLYELTPSLKNHGRFLSELVRQEARIREDRQRRRATQTTRVMGEVGRD